MENSEKRLAAAATTRGATTCPTMSIPYALSSHDGKRKPKAGDFVHLEAQVTIINALSGAKDAAKPLRMGAGQSAVEEAEEAGAAIHADMRTMVNAMNRRPKNRTTLQRQRRTDSQEILDEARHLIGAVGVQAVVPHPNSPPDTNPVQNKCNQQCAPGHIKQCNHS